MHIPTKTVYGCTLGMAVPLLVGCDPLVNIEGAFFPAWLVSGVFGILATSMTYWLFDRADMHKYLLAPVLTYLALMITYTGALWLVFYGW
jgi:hypothetical protein